MKAGYAALGLLACACNDIYGIRSTGLVDARYFDAGIDAPFACPPAPETPQFSRNLIQAVLQPVYGYTTSTVTGRATGIDNNVGVVEGPIDSTMTLAKGLANPIGCDSCAYFVSPRITPEGDGIYVLKAAFDAHILLYQPTDGTWLQTQDFGLASALGSVTRGPVRHMITVDGAGNLREYALTDSGTLTQSDPVPYSPADLGVGSFPHGSMLTPDGLHMIFVAQDDKSKEHVYYADRPDVGARFSMGRLMPEIPAVDEAYMTEDCSRIYLPGLGSVFYAPRM